MITYVTDSSGNKILLNEGNVKELEMLKKEVKESSNDTARLEKEFWSSRKELMEEQQNLRDLLNESYAIAKDSSDFINELKNKSFFHRIKFLLFGN